MKAIIAYLINPTNLINLIIFVGTIASGFILVRYHSHHPPAEGTSFRTSFERWVSTRAYLILPVVVTTFFSSLLWLLHSPASYRPVWALVVLLYFIITLTMPWVKGAFRGTAFAFLGLSLVGIVGAVAAHLLHAALFTYAFLLFAYLMIPVTLVAFFLAFFVPHLVPISPSTSAEERKRLHKQAMALFGAFFSGFPRPVIAVQEGKLVTRSPGNPFLGSGPGLVMTEPEYAVLVRDGSRVRRLIGPGVVFTGDGDVADYVFDLRRQLRTTRVHARTRDGIELDVPLASIFHIQRGDGEEPALDKPWPYRPSAAFKLYFSLLVDPADKTPLEAQHAEPWQNIPLKEGVPRLQQVISRYTLDHIYGAPQSNRRGQDGLLRVQMGAEVRQHVAEAVKDRGITVIGGGIGNVIRPVDDAIFKERIRAWQARWAQEALRREGQVSIEMINAFYRARQDVIQEMLTGLKEQARHLRRQEQGGLSPKTALSLYLLQTLEDIAHRSEAQRFLPTELTETLDKLHRRMLEGNGESAGEEG